jgi:hypothetical protein
VLNELAAPEYMNTGPKGTFPSRDFIVDEKNQYVKDKNLPIVTVTTRDFRQARSYVQGGWDVELVINYNNDSNSGHMAFVTDVNATEFTSNNQPKTWQVLTVQDGNQDDMRPANDPMTYTFNADGTPTRGNNEFLGYFVIECVVPEPSALVFLFFSGAALLQLSSRRLHRRGLRALPD